MKKYYWASSTLLGDGSTVTPGNWGRMIKQYRVDVFGNPWLLVREYIFEDIRRQSYSNKPSRFNCLFLCKDIDSMKEFINSNNKVTDIIYEVEILDDSQLTFEFDWKGVNLSRGESVIELESKAHNYWKAENINSTEVLTESSIRIIKKIQ